MEGMRVLHCNWEADSEVFHKGFATSLFVQLARRVAEGRLAQIHHAVAFGIGRAGVFAHRSAWCGPDLSSDQRPIRARLDDHHDQQSVHPKSGS